MDKVTYHAARRRLDQSINAAVLRLRTGATQQNTEYVQRAAEDLAQAVDELLVLVGGHELVGSGQQLDCPDCGQYLGE
ncbi:MAG: hypothetical protein GWN58_56690 [Anaerolineae bacterium]|nr:hypothetical protein [Anaerolineae bacterium]